MVFCCAHARAGARVRSVLPMSAWTCVWVFEGGGLHPPQAEKEARWQQWLKDNYRNKSFIPPGWE